MASPRSGATGGGIGRSGGADGTGGPTNAEESIPLGRRIGVIAVIVALGGAIVLAAGIGGGGGGGGTTHPSTQPSSPPASITMPSGSLATALPSPPVVVPAIAAPDAAIIATRTWTASVTVPDPGVPLRSLDLVVYRNGRAVLTQRLRNNPQVNVKNIPLKRGLNKISVALANAGGEGPHSAAVAITVDDQAPTIMIKSPHDGDVLNATSVTVRGTTDDPGSPVVVRNVQLGQSIKVTAANDGTFQADVDLEIGPDTVTVSSVDALGNKSLTTLDLNRGDGSAHATLTVTPEAVRLKDLPAKLDIRVVVDDGNGRPVDGAMVTFNVSQPGETTATYDTTTKDGVAEMTNVPLASDGAVAGDGFVGALVTLADGTFTRANVPLTFK